MQTIEVKSRKHSDMIDITAAVRDLVPAGINGVCHIFCKHTTAGLTINENADPAVCADIQTALEKIVPWDQSFFRHFEGNSAAHLKSSLLGFSQMVPVKDGRLVLGTWQGIYFCEFDGPRSRSVTVQFMLDVRR
jgi:secondary thiamine-phosphate synthase enzyme